MFANKRHLVQKRTRAPAVKLSPQAAEILSLKRAQKRSEEDKAVSEVLDYIDNAATELAQRFQCSRQRYINKFYLGSKLRHNQKKKTSPWSAYMHYTSLEVNDGMYFLPVSLSLTLVS